MVSKTGLPMYISADGWENKLVKFLEFCLKNFRGIKLFWYDTVSLLKENYSYIIIINIKDKLWKTKLD